MSVNDYNPPQNVLCLTMMIYTIKINFQRFLWPMQFVAKIIMWYPLPNDKNRNYYLSIFVIYDAFWVLVFKKIRTVETNRES